MIATYFTKLISVASALVTLGLPANYLEASSALVSEDTIRKQMSATKIEKLSNGIPVILREIPGSDIIEIMVGYKTGFQDLAPTQKAALEIMAQASSMGGRGYPKDVAFRMYEKYSLEVGCNEGNDAFICRLGTLNEYWREVMPLFAATSLYPLLNKEDVEVARGQLLASNRSLIEQPSRYINDVVNQVFYPEGHPFRKLAKDHIAALEKVTVEEVRSLQQSLLSSDNLYISVVSSLPSQRILPELNRHFGKIGKKVVPQVTPADPAFDKNKSFKFEDRPIPTAYLSLKFNALNKHDPDFELASFAVHILDETLDEELRTKRSLTYGCQAGIIGGDIGIGVITATTSKPKETLSGISEVVKTLRDKKIQPEQLELYKKVFATGYFLGLETHQTIGDQLISSLMSFGSFERFYQVPQKVASITAEDVQKILQKMLKNFRVGVVFDKKDFKDEWATEVIQKSLVP